MLKLFLFLVTLLTLTNATKMTSEITHEVTFTIRHGDKLLGDITLGLFGKAVPKSVDNFVKIAEGYKKAEYKGTIFHRVIKGFMIQGGDFENSDGTGGWSIYGKKFEDENFDINFVEPGLLAYANSGPDSNGSQFFITTKITDWLNGRHVIFGRVTKGMDVVTAIENVKTNMNVPVEPVVISEVKVKVLDKDSGKDSNPDSNENSGNDKNSDNDQEPGETPSSHKKWLLFVLLFFVAAVGYMLRMRYIQNKEVAEEIEFHRV